MKIINLEDLREFLYSDESIDEGIKLSSNCSISNFSINEKNSLWHIVSNIDSYHVELNVNYDNISECNCTCEFYLSSKKICLHIVALVEIYNQYVSHNLTQFKHASNVSFNIAPIIIDDENNDKKIEVQFYFEYDYKKFFILDANILFSSDDRYYFFPLLYFSKDQINPEYFNLIDNLKKILLLNKHTLSNSKVYIDMENMNEWIEFFNSFNITFFYNNNRTWNITEYYLDGFNYEFNESCKPSVNNKRKFHLKINNRDTNFFYNVSDDCVYLFVHSKQKFIVKIYKYPIDKLENVKTFCEFVNKQVSKNNFYRLYLSIKKLFANYERVIEYLFIIKNNVSKIDPVLEVKVYYEKLLNVLAVKLSFFYGENEYPYKENEDNYFRRERFLEQKLLEPLLSFFNFYNLEFKVFEIIDQQKYFEFIEWSKKMNKNDLYDIKISEDLVFKPKVRKEFHINSSSFDNDFLKIEWSLQGFDKEDMLKILSAYKQKLKYVTLSNNKIINLELEIDFDSLKEELSLLNTSIDALTDGVTNVNKLNSNYFLENFNPSNKEELQEYFNKLYGDESVVKNELPESLNKILKSYQKTGYLWLKKLIHLNAGGILADEMGLGKTLQTISLLLDVYFNKSTTKPSLVVCPSSLVYNWKKELNQFAPFLKVGIIDGSQIERFPILDNCHDYNVIVTSYHLLNKDIEKYKNIDFYLQILDEAQKIKNHYTQFSKDTKAIKSEYKIALTGTPIENNLLELWSIFDYLMPGFLYDYKTFKTFFQEKIVAKDDVTLKKLKSKIDPFILRRTKKEVLKELPSKTYKVLTSEFNEEQKQMYLTELNKSKLMIKKSISDNSITKQGVLIFSILTRLRQICCSPKLIYENSTTNGSKFALCIELIKDLIKNDDKILLFSQFTSMIDLIAAELKKLKINFLVLTGDTNKKDRIELVNEFNNKKHIKVFLISLKAGGTGLTLTSANAVIHYDPWWNLSLENQATDRAHRIGQERNVFIYKLISKGSIEEKIISLQESKREIIEQIFDENTSNKNSLSMNEILKVFDMDK